MDDVVTATAEIWVDGAHIDDATVVDGRVEYDASRRVLRTCQVTLTGDLPDGPQHPLAPSGSGLKLWRNGLPLGMFVFDKSDVQREGRTVTIAGYDLSWLISRNRWETPYLIGSGTNLVDAVVAAVRDRLPAVWWREASTDDTDVTTPDVVWGEERHNDPWDDILQLAQAAGKRVWFDRDGRLQVARVPDPDETPVLASLTVGESVQLLDVSRTLDGHAYNVVVASGETDDSDTDPVTATVEDDDPSSPSYVGRYRRPYFLTSGYITTETQARDAAARELAKHIGVGETVQLGVTAMPELDVWDTIAIVDDELHIGGRHVIDRMSLPAGAGAGSITTRRRRL